MYQQTGIEAVNNVANLTDAFKAGGSIHHYTIKGNCTGSTLPGGHCANLHDARPATPVDDASTYWLVWVCGVVSSSNACNGANVTDIWLYNQVDTIVGNREFLARPSALSQLTSVVPPAAQTNLINSALFAFGDTLGAATNNCVATNLTTCDWPAPLPADVQNIVNSIQLNMAFTDTRPEDAYYGTQRILATPADTAAPWTKLGYGPGPVGTAIISGLTGATATPVAFGLPGMNDPITGNPVPTTIQVFPVGEEAIVFITNRTNAAGLGTVSGVVPTYSNVIDNGPLGSGFGTPSPIGELFGGGASGYPCDGTNPAFGSHPSNTFAVNPILREPLSGTMNTTEFTAFRTFGGSLVTNGSNSVGHGSTNPGTSQEANVAASGTPINPLGGGPAFPGPGTPCAVGAGKRWHSVGTGEEVGNGVKAIQDSIGYTFFSYGNVSTIGQSASYGYLTLDGVDPIFASYAGGDPGQPATTAGTIQGTLPKCDVTKGNGAGGCTVNAVWTGGKSWPHLRDGTYRAWSILRAICDTATPNCDQFNSTTGTGDKFGVVALIEAVQDDIHNSGAQSVADFLPLSLDGSFPAGAESIWGDANFARSHYAFTSIGAGLPSDYPATHTSPSFNLVGEVTPAGATPALTENAAQSNGTFSVPISTGAGFFLGGSYTGHYFSLEQGGDAGGCIINAGQSGDLLTLTAVQPINNASGTPNVNHVKWFFTNDSGPNSVTEPNAAAATFGPDSPGAGGPWGWCGGGGRNGLYCNQSNTGPSNPATVPPAPQCGAVGFNGDAANPFGYTCNPAKLTDTASTPGAGESITVTGITTASYTDFNGTFHISKFVSPGVIKTNISNSPVVYPAGLAKKTVNAGAQASVSNGCVQ
jgi:hypothetical protein